MRLLVSGATTTIRKMLASPIYGQLASDHLGHLLTPANGNRLDVLLDTGLPIAVDNGAFASFLAGQSFDWKGYQRFVAMLADVWHADPRLHQALRFVAVPDAVGNAAQTVKMWDTWRYVVLPGACNLPWAFVGQNGQTPRNLPMIGDPRFGPWVGISALFVGGDTAWKRGSEAATLIHDARTWGRWVHVGRVNSRVRFEPFDALGVQSFDGGQFSMFPDTYIPRWLERLSHRQRGMWRAA